jgi:hypothetical protein
MNAKRKTLGRLQKTARGFDFIEFKDHYGARCSLQASSLAIYKRPGTSAVWLGCEKETVHEVTGEKIGARMHLTRQQAASLIFHLQNWLATDSFKLTI